MIPAFLILSVAFLLNHMDSTLSYPMPFGFAGVSLTNTVNVNTVKPSSPFWKKTQEKEKVTNRLRKSVRDLTRCLVEGSLHKGPRIMHHVIYWLTAFDAIQSVRCNEYRVWMKNYFLKNTPFIQNGVEGRFVPSVYSKLFYFAHLRPRLLYSVGALLRAVQLCTPFQTVLDPSAGVGAGVNMCAMIAGSRWVQPFVLGWATTKCIWVWLGAHQMQGAHLPIKVSIRELEKKETRKDGGGNAGI